MSKTLKQVFDHVNAVKPNSFPLERLTEWMNEIEGLVQTEVLLWATEEIVTYEWPRDENTELLVQPPHDKLYAAYLEAKIDFENGEYKKYANTNTVANTFFDEYSAWFALFYRPADTHREVYI